MALLPHSWTGAGTDLAAPGPAASSQGQHAVGASMAAMPKGQILTHLPVGLTPPPVTPLPSQLGQVRRLPGALLGCGSWQQSLSCTLPYARFLVNTSRRSRSPKALSHKLLDATCCTRLHAARSPACPEAFRLPAGAWASTSGLQARSLGTCLRTVMLGLWSAALVGSLSLRHADDPPTHARISRSSVDPCGEAQGHTVASYNAMHRQCPGLRAASCQPHGESEDWTLLHSSCKGGSQHIRSQSVWTATSMPHSSTRGQPVLLQGRPPVQHAGSGYGRAEHR